MAGDWIKVEVTLPDKPEVVRMADLLGLDQDAVAGKCLRFWIWLNQQSSDGHALSVTPAFVDRLCACEGFGYALQTVGWAHFQNGGLVVPHFDRHNSESAKQRALALLRKRDQRARNTGNSHAPVTPVSRSGRDRSVTREERIEIEGGGCAGGRAPAGARVSRDDANPARKDTTTTTPPEAGGPDPQADGVPYREIVAAWNELCPELRAVTQRTVPRDERIRAFWLWAGTLENVRAVFTRVGRSNLLNGRPHRTKADRKPYKTHFDKVVDPDLAARIVEGHFDDEPES